MTFGEQESNVPSDGHTLRLYVVLIFFVVDNFTNEDMCVFTFSVLHMFRHKKRVTGTRVGLSCYVIVIVIFYSNIIVFYMKRGWLKLLLLFYCYFLFNREKIDRSWWLKCQQKNPGQARAALLRTSCNLFLEIFHKHNRNANTNTTFKWVNLLFGHSI